MRAAAEILEDLSLYIGGVSSQILVFCDLKTRDQTKFLKRRWNSVGV